MALRKDRSPVELPRSPDRTLTGARIRRSFFELDLILWTRERIDCAQVFEGTSVILTGLGISRTRV